MALPIIKPTSRSPAARSLRSVEIKEDGKRTIDASDLIVAPGFIDPHTHYDAQMCWDSLMTCSSWHGVTTVITGNCGVGIAPCRPEAHEVVAWDLVNVEGIPFEVLNRGVTWDWVSFPDFMDAAARRGLSINAGCFAPLTPFRHFVMGEESMERAARPEETAQIRALLRDALAAGAFGFSTTNTLQHTGYKGRPLACRLASTEELRDLRRRSQRTWQRRHRDCPDPDSRPDLRRGMGVGRDAAQTKAAGG